MTVYAKGRAGLADRIANRLNRSARLQARRSTTSTGNFFEIAGNLISSFVPDLNERVIVVDDARDRSGDGFVDRRRVRRPLRKSNVVGSEIVDGEGRPTGRHKIALDIDVPHYYAPSSTFGHGHLIIEADLELDLYLELLDVLNRCGVIEPLFAAAAEARGGSWLRTPWTRKPSLVRPGSAY